MSTVTPELRTPVMVLVDVAWEDASGTVHTSRARMEDKSAGGACIRLKSRIEPGTRLTVQWRFEQFSGVVKYCRSQERDFLAGIQRDATLIPIIGTAPGAGDPGSEARGIELRSIDPRKIESPPAGTIEAPGRQEEFRPSTTPGIPASTERAQAVQFADSAIETPRRISYAVERQSLPRVVNAQDFEVARQSGRRSEPLPQEAGMERKLMGHKWLGLVPRHEKQDKTSASGENTNCGSSEKENLMPNSNQPTEKMPAHAREVPTFEVELLSMEDVYRAAGVLSPRKGYSVNKVAEMLNSEHIRALSKEMKRAAVLMALDAAGVSIEQVQRDAKARRNALDAYEAEQTKQAGVEWARKAEEIALIQSELESIKSHYMARITRNQEAVARDKARFSNWVATKQQEAQSMMEALDLCLKSQVSDPPSPPPAEIGMAANAGAGAAASVSPKPQ